MIAINTARWEVIEYAYPWDQNAHKIVSKQPGPLPKYLAIFHPFSAGVWIATLVTYIAVSNLHALIAHEVNSCNKQCFAWVAFATVRL